MQLNINLKISLKVTLKMLNIILKKNDLTYTVPKKKVAYVIVMVAAWSSESDP